MAELPRRFPTPWPPDNVPGGCVVRDAAGQTLACLYGRETEAEARQGKSTHERRAATNCRRRRAAAGALGKSYRA